MKITYLNRELRHLNLKLREAFAGAGELARERIQMCRRLAMGLPCSETDLTASEDELIARLEGVIAYARSRGMQQVVGWCMVAAQGESVGDSDYHYGAIRPVITAFLAEYVPAPARVLDIASGTGCASLPLATQGYELSLLDPAEPFLQSARHAADRDSVGDQLRSLMCGTFADLGELETESQDVCLCLGSLLYARPREDAEEIFQQLSRVAAKAVIVDVASKHGLILQLGATFDVSAQAIEQILTTGTTPPGRPEHGGVVYSCFSSDELRETARQAGLTVRCLIGYGMRETLELGTSEPLPAGEALRIEALLQREDQLLDSFPSLLALCTKASD